MKPYEIEIFDRHFNFVYNALLDESNFNYKFDYISPEKFTVILPKDFVPKNLSEDSHAPIGWIIRIFRNSEEYQGIISGYDTNNSINTVTIQQLISLMNTQNTVRKSALSSTTVEAYIKERITASFVNNPDTLQNLTGLSATNITTTTSTTGRLPYQENDDDFVVLDLVNDLIIPAETVYGIHTNIRLNVADKAILISIGKPVNNNRIIEADLPNIIEKNINIHKSSAEINRVDIYDSFIDRNYVYYLHPNGTYDKTNSNRIVPVYDEDYIFSSYNEASAAVDAMYSQYYDQIDDLYNGVYRDKYGDTATQNFAEWVANFWYSFSFGQRHFKYAIALEEANSYEQYGDPSVEIDEADEGSYTTFDYVPGEYSNKLYVYGEWLCTGGYRGSAHENPATPYYSINSKPTVIVYSHTFNTPWYWYLKENQQLTFDTQQNESAIFVAGQVAVAKKSAPEVPIYLNISAKIEKQWLYDVLGTKKAQEVETYRRQYAEQASPVIAQNVADEIFAKNKYTNFIELTMRADDTMINPLSMEIGQIVSIIHDGVSYDSILTGKEIHDGIVKLIFGTIRLELTKILNMKGV